MTSESGKPPSLEFEKVLTSDLAIVEIDGKPTCSFADGLDVVKAISIDAPERHLGYGIPRDMMIPTRDLSEAARAHPFSGNARHLSALDYARAIGVEVFDKSARAEGFASFEDQHRSMPKDYPGLKQRWRLFEGGIILDADANYSGRLPTTWQDLLDDYHADDDPVVAEYFDSFQQSVRVDLARLLTQYMPSPFLKSRREADRVRVVSGLSSFIIGLGYSLDQGWRAVSSDMRIADAKAQKPRPRFKGLPPPPLVRPDWMDKS